MSGKQVAVGADVRTKDGTSIGKVEHLVFDSRTNSIAGVVADKGIFDQGTVVDIEHIAEFGESTVTLEIGEEEARNLPKFVEQEYFRFGNSVAFAGGSMAGTVGAPISTGGNWVHYGSGSGGLPNTGATSFFQPAVIGDVQARVVGPLTESDIVIDNDTHVITSDGEKIGVVDDFLLDDEGKIVGYIVEQGHVFHHDVQIPAEWVVGITHDHLRLNVTKDEAGKSKR